MPRGAQRHNGGRLFGGGSVARTVILGTAVVLHVLLVWSFLAVYVPGARLRALAEWQGRLGAMADDRRQAIEDWSSERLSDAAMLVALPAIRERLTTAGDPAAVALARAHIDAVLADVAGSYRYRGACVLGPGGDPIACAGGVLTLDDSLRRMGRDAVAARRRLIGIHTGADGSPVVVTVAPLDAGASPSPGAVLLVMDPERWLFPLLRSEPSPTRTRETILAERRGNRWVVAGPLRGAAAPPPAVVVPLEEDAARGVRISDGLARYTDHRGVPVLATARLVAGTPWALVVKLDRAEAFEGAAERIRARAVDAALLVLGFWGVVYGVWKTRRAREERAVRRAEQRLAIVLEHAREIVLFADPDGRITGCNEAALEAYGFTRDELLALRLEDLTAASPDAAASEDGLTAGTTEGRWQESLHRRKDGSVFPVELSARTVELDGQPMRVGVVRDISERKAAEERIRRLNGLLRVSSEISQLIVHETDRDRLLAGACRIAATHADFCLSWIGLLDEATAEVVPAACAGPAEGYVAAIQVHTTRTSRGRGPTGTAVRDGITAVANDWTTDERIAPWRELGRSYGIRSSVALPLKAFGRCIGAFTAYSTRKDAFDEETVRLLEDVAADLGYALQALDEAARRRQAEADVQDSRERYRSLFEHAPIPYWEEDLSAVQALFDELRGRGIEDFRAYFESQPEEIRRTLALISILDVNAASLEFFGVESREHLSRLIPDHLGDDALDAAREQLVSLAGGATVVHSRIPVRTANGARRIVEMTMSVMPGAETTLERVLVSWVDVTEREQALEALRSSEEKYRLITTSVSDGIFTIDLEGRFTFISPHWLELTGYREEDLIGRPFSSALPEGEGRHAEAMFLRAREGDSIPLYELEIVGRDGRRIPIELNVSDLENTDGRTIGRIGVFRDVSQRRQAETALRRSEERLNLALESTGLGLWDWDLAADRVTLNDRWAAILGYQRDEIEAEQDPWESRVHPDDLAAAKTALHRHLDGETPVYESEHRLRSRSGGWVWVLDRGRVVERDAGGKPVRMVGTQQDVSARRASEEERNLLVAAVEQAAECIVITDAEGSIEYVNPAFTRVTGYGRAEVLGANPRILKSGRHPEAFYRSLWDTILAGDEWHGRMVNRRRDGTLFEEESTIFPVRDQQGGIVSFVAVKRDVTAEVALEEQLNQAQKMETVGRLAGGVAHDFNNLLQALLAQVQLLRLTPGDAQEVAETTRELEEQIRRGAALTRQLLLFSRRQTTQREPLDLNEVVGGSTRLLGRLLRENVRLEVVPAPGPLPVEADRAQLEQILVNLAINGADAMPEGGRLTVSAGGAGDEVWLEVSDAGSGVPEAIRDKIFDPFFTTKAIGKGTGLGLSVVHGIVVQHGGRVELGSPSGQGAAFRVVLPRSRQESAALAGRAPVDGEALPRGRGERVLLVEDEEHARTAFQRMLDRLGYHVVAVGGAEEAGLLPEVPVFDLLLSDLVLPTVSGDELARVLTDRWPDIKVLLMSGYTDDETVRRGIEDHTINFLRKPFDLGILATTIRAVLDED